MKILLLRVIPKNLSKSSTYILEKYFLKNLELKWKVKVHDLYRDNRVPRMDTFTLNNVILKEDKSNLNKKEQKIWNQKLKIAKEVSEADKIVIFSPFWTGFFPSILKDYIDLIPVYNLTYKFSKDKKSMLGICNGEMTMIQTMGANFAKNASNYGFMLAKRNFAFYGIKKSLNIIWKQTAVNKDKFKKDTFTEIDKLTEGWRNG